MARKINKVSILFLAKFLVASGIGLVIAGVSLVPKWNNPITLFGTGAILLLCGSAIEGWVKN